MCVVIKRVVSRRADFPSWVMTPGKVRSWRNEFDSSFKLITQHFALRHLVPILIRDHSTISFPVLAYFDPALMTLFAGSTTVMQTASANFTWNDVIERYFDFFPVLYAVSLDLSCIRQS